MWKSWFVRFAFSWVVALGLLSTALPASARAVSSAILSISEAELPPEAQATLKAIRKGGPFPYRRDGIEFQNRESRLPIQARGHYREYTVITPYARDRGAQRIIAGAPDVFYYTADHYRSFKRVIP